MTDRHPNFIQSYFHGTKATLSVGDLVVPGKNANYGERKAKFVYASSNLNVAIWGAELHNIHVSLEDLWGSGINRLREEFCRAGSVAAKFSLIETFLLSRMGPHRKHPAVRFGVAPRVVESRG